VLVPVFSGTAVREAVPPLEAYDAVRDGFVRHARGEWTMQPKVYVANYPAGDFRAMPALGGGHALLKWVTSFPGNPARGLPTVTGLVLLSNAETGELEAVLDAAAVTALRTAAAGVVAAEALGRAGGSTAVIGLGVNGAETVRMFRARGAEPLVWDVDPERLTASAQELGARPAESLEQALAADSVVTVTPGREILFCLYRWFRFAHHRLISPAPPARSSLRLDSRPSLVAPVASLPALLSPGRGRNDYCIPYEVCGTPPRRSCPDLARCNRLL